VAGCGVFYDYVPMLGESPAYKERSPNVPEWSHEVIFLGTKQEHYERFMLFLASIFIA